MTVSECLETAHEWMLEYAKKHGVKSDDMEWVEIMAVLAKARRILNDE